MNGTGIRLVDYEAELKRFRSAQTALGNPTPTADQEKQVLEDLIDQTLLAQGAAEGGYQAGAAEVQSRVDALSQKLGGADALVRWQSEHGYTEAEFRATLALEMAAAWERDQIINQVPAAAEQVHARQILVAAETDAQKALDKLNSGVKFATLAFKYDPVSGGDLGWFPKGYLEAPEVETAAFELQVDQYSGIIKSSVGYHIVQVIERDPAHPLTTDQRLILQKTALEKWLQDRRAASQIDRLIP